MPKQIVQNPVSVVGRIERTTRDDAQALGLNVSEIIRKAVEQAVYDAQFIFPAAEPPWEAEILRLTDYAKQHNYCIRELTEMVMDLDVRIKKLQHVNEELKLDNTGLWREFAELHTRVTKK